MPGALHTIRLSRPLAAALAHSAQRRRSTPGEVIENLLDGHGPTRDELRAIIAPGPFSVKVTFRLSTKAQAHLKELEGKTLERSESLRRLLAWAFARQGILPAAPGEAAGEPGGGGRRRASWAGPSATLAAAAAAPLLARGSWIAKLLGVLVILALALLPILVLDRQAAPRPEDSDDPPDSSS